MWDNNFLTIFDSFFFTISTFFDNVDNFWTVMTFFDIFTILGIFTIFFHFYLKFWQLWTKEGWSQAGPMGRKLEVMAQQAPRRLLAHILPLLKMQWWWQCFLVCCRLPQWHNLKDGQDLPSCHISRSCGWPILCFLDGQYFAVTFPIQSHLLAHIKFHFHRRDICHKQRLFKIITTTQVNFHFVNVLLVQFK